MGLAEVEVDGDHQAPKRQTIKSRPGHGECDFFSELGV